LSLKSQDPALNAVISSPVIVKTDRFGLKSNDVNAGHLVCDAWVSVVIKSKRYGTIVVPAADVDFDIRQTEQGPTISLLYTYFMGFMEMFSDKLKEHSIVLIVDSGK
jgi:hypothetical protein